MFTIHYQPFAFQFSASDEEEETKSLRPESVEGFISTIEQAGFTCKRCSNPEEVIDFARDPLTTLKIKVELYTNLR